VLKRASEADSDEIRRLCLIADLGETTLRLGGLKALGWNEAETARELNLTPDELQAAQLELSAHPPDGLNHCQT